MFQDLHLFCFFIIFNMICHSIEVHLGVTSQQPLFSSGGDGKTLNYVKQYFRFPNNMWQIGYGWLRLFVVGGGG